MFGERREGVTAAAGEDLAERVSAPRGSGFVEGACDLPELAGYAGRLFGVAGKVPAAVPEGSADRWELHAAVSVSGRFEHLFRECSDLRSRFLVGADWPGTDGD
uniref:(northern house mosquito) hypothetical protein n=1 Tax=Culex pipiens TaxID=7175 RepID=A0A8D8EUD8_CULPI